MAVRRMMLLGTLLALLVRCGARSQLDLAQQDGLGGAGGDGGDIGAGGEAQAGGGGSVEPPCLLEVAGPPLEAMSFPQRHAYSPALVVADRGQPGDAAQIGVQALTSDTVSHSINELSRWRLAEPWPEASEQEVPPTLFGIESHSWGAMATSLDGQQAAMIWSSDPGGMTRLAFRSLDLSSWAAGEPVDVSFEATGPLAIAGGAAVGRFGVGYGGQGYAVASRRTVDVDDGFASRPEVVIVDPAGQVLLGPHALGPFRPSPGVSPSLVWSGSTYLMATSFGACDDEDCPGALTLHRFRPASGDAFDDSGTELVWSTSGSGVPRRPVLASHDGRTWLAHFDGPADEEAPVDLLLYELAADGEMVTGPMTVEEGIVVAGRLRMAATPLGLVLMWARDGDASLSPSEPGHSQLELRHFHEGGGPASPPLTLPITAFFSATPTALAAIAEPRGVVASWSGRGPNKREVAFLALLRCQR